MHWSIRDAKELCRFSLQVLFRSDCDSLAIPGVYSAKGQQDLRIWAFAASNRLLHAPVLVEVPPMDALVPTVGWCWVAGGL